MQNTYGNIVAGADLSSSNKHVVELSSDGTIVLAGNGGRAFGLLLDGPKQGMGSSILVHGVDRAVAGDVITAGAVVTSDASGRVIPATAGTYPVGRALAAAGQAGQVIQVFVNPSMHPLAA